MDPELPSFIDQRQAGDFEDKTTAGGTRRSKKSKKSKKSRKTRRR